MLKIGQKRGRAWKEGGEGDEDEDAADDDRGAGGGGGGGFRNGAIPYQARRMKMK